MTDSSQPPRLHHALRTDLRRTLSRSQRLLRPQVWQARLAVWLGAALVATVVIAFSILVDRANQAFNLLRSQQPLLPLLLTPAGGMAIVWLTRRHFPGWEGSGIPQVIVALKPRTRPELRQRLTALPGVGAKIILGALALLCGFSSGKEGPSVQIGASLMLQVHRLLPRSLRLNRDHLLMAGGAAGIAVAFNTPIAGIVFAIEELGRRYDRQANIVLLAAIIVAAAVANFHWGNFTYFGRISLPATTPQEMLPMLLSGLAGGLCGGLFGRLMVVGCHSSLTAFGRYRSRRPIVFAGLCGLAVAVLGLLSHGAVHGGGYLITRQALEHGNPLPPGFAVEKMLATLFSYFSGIPGGIFAPSLAVGAGLGQDLQQLTGSSLAPQAWMAMGMAAFLAGVTQVPITAFVIVIVMEMIDGHAMVLSLITASLVASLIARIFTQPPYHALARQLQGR